MANIFILRNFALLFSPHHILYAITIVISIRQIKKKKQTEKSNLLKPNSSSVLGALNLSGTVALLNPKP